MAAPLNIKKTGDWNAVAGMLNGLQKEIEIAAQQTTMQIGLHAEGLARKHMTNQDLGWQELKARTITVKSKRGGSDLILVDTSSYFQAITSWFDKAKGIAYVGIKKTVKNEDGEEIADIAKVHEYGSVVRNVPARPLWQPTENEMQQVVAKSKLFKVNLNKRLAKYGINV